MVMINYFMWIGMIQVSNTRETMEGMNFAELEISFTIFQYYSKRRFVLTT